MNALDYIKSTTPRKAYAHLDDEIAKAYAELDENDRLLNSVPTGRGQAKERQRQAKAELAADPSSKDARRKFNAAMSASDPEIIKGERAVYKSRGRQIDRTLTRLTSEVAKALLPSAEKALEKAEKIEGETAAAVGLSYVPSSGAGALAKAVSGLRDLANLPPGATLQRAQLDALLK